MDNLYRNTYNNLSQTAKEEWLKKIPILYPEFCFLRFEHFNRFGMELYTAVYLYDEKEFVFVPGDHITLGWESFEIGMNEETSAEIKSILEADEIEEFDIVTFLQQQSSPLRKANISPMLVERELNEIGWKNISLDSKELTAYKKDIEDFRKQTYQQLTIYKTLRLTKVNNQIEAALYQSISYADFLSTIESVKGFSLPTEDEWEYLCGGGKRTLFRWGDSFDYNMNLHHFSNNDSAELPYTLQKPNHFGIQIAYDPYQYEVIKLSNNQILKGGDGGCNLCGGMGIVMGYLPISTYFRNDTDILDDYKNEIGGDFTFYRRIFTLKR